MEHESKDIQEDEANSESAPLEELFLHPEPSQLALADLRSFCNNCQTPSLKSLAEVFLANLESGFWIAALPAFIAASGAHQLIRNQYFHAERMSARAAQLRIQAAAISRGEKTGETEENLDEIWKIAEIKATEAKTAIDTLTRRTLQGFHDAKVATNDISQEVLRQALVLCWTAIEVLANDLAVLLLNLRPILILRIAEDETCKKLLKNNIFSFNNMATYGFDLSRRLGDLVISELQIDNVQRMKAIYNPLFAETSILPVLSTRCLWELQQTRNLILHRRGIVDEKYAAFIDGKLKPGVPICVTVSDLQQAITCVEATGHALLSAAELLLNHMNKTEEPLAYDTAAE